MWTAVYDLLRVVMNASALTCADCGAPSMFTIPSAELAAVLAIAQLARCTLPCMSATCSGPRPHRNCRSRFISPYSPLHYSGTACVVSRRARRPYTAPTIIVYQFAVLATKLPCLLQILSGPQLTGASSFATSAAASIGVSDATSPRSDRSGLPTGHLSRKR